MVHNAEQTALLRDRGAMEEALRSAKPWSVVKGSQVTCPSPGHEDTHPSGSIKADGEGEWHFTCHSCGFFGDIFDVRAAVNGTTPADELAKLNGNKPKAAKIFDSIAEMTAGLSGLEAVYQYVDPDTKRIDLLVIRQRLENGKKKFIQASQISDGRFMQRQRPGKQPLYNRARVRKADTVYVVEGEKCVHALHDIGLVATTSPGGSNAASFADWTPLAGKNIVLWPDNDDCGRTYADDVQSLVSQIASVVRIDPAELDLSNKEDVVDYIQQVRVIGLDPREQIEAIAAKARNVCPSTPLLERLDAIHDGQWVDVPWPWQRLTRLGRGLLPQNVCLFCGGAGQAKSLYVMYSLLFWLENGVRFAYLDMEEDLTYNLQRALAMLSANGDLLDQEYIQANQDVYRQAYNEHKGTLDKLASHIHTIPDTDITTDWVCDWTKQQAESGQRLIIIDPITVASPSSKPWISDHQFVTRTKRILKQYQSAILLITHPRKGCMDINMDSLAGGAAYQRLSHAMFWLQYHGRKGKDAKIATAMGTIEENIQHTIKILKSRKGKGTGISLGFCSHWDTMSFTEMGIITE